MRFTGPGTIAVGSGLDGLCVVRGETDSLKWLLGRMYSVGRTDRRFSSGSADGAEGDDGR